MSVCLSPTPPWPPYERKQPLRCVNCGRPVRETGGGSTLRRWEHTPRAEQ